MNEQDALRQRRIDAINKLTERWHGGRAPMFAQPELPRAVYRCPPDEPLVTADQAADLARWFERSV